MKKDTPKYRITYQKGIVVFKLKTPRVKKSIKTAPQKTDQLLMF